MRVPNDVDREAIEGLLRSVRLVHYPDMSPHPLDRPIWHALTSRQAQLAVGGGRARRLNPDYGPFAAAADDSPEALADLAALLPQDDTVVLLQVGYSPLPPGTVAERRALGVQMVLDRLAAPGPLLPIDQLGDADAPEMMALAKLTEPGPFERLTHRFGNFQGIRNGGRLAAMAGERMKLTGYTEVSGVATHPDFRGRGYAAALTHAGAARILEEGEIPFLHAYASNSGAIALYRRLGFVQRCEVQVTVLRRA